MKTLSKLETNLKRKCKGLLNLLQETNLHFQKILKFMNNKDET